MGGRAQARPDAEAFLIKVLLFIDVIFIDGGHSYETVKEDFYNYVKFLKPSGIIFFDDYTPEPGFGIKQLVDELIDAAEYNITIDERYTDTYRGYLFQVAKVTKKEQEDG